MPTAPAHLTVEVESEDRRWIRTAAARNHITAAALIRAAIHRLRTDEALLAWCVAHATD